MSRQEIVLAAGATLPAVRLLAAASRAVLEAWHLPEARVGLLELALVEAATNVVRHAYGDGPPGRLEIHLAREGRTFCVAVVDHGRSFDPAGVPPPPEPDPNDPSTWPDRGGMGLPLIRSACEKLTYVSEEGRNRLILTFSADEEDGP